MRQKISLQKGIPTDKAREMVKLLKGSKLKVQAAIQGDQLRVSGKSKDDLQAAMRVLRGKLLEARAKAREAFSRFPKAAYMTEIEFWREKPDGCIEFTIRRLPAKKPTMDHAPNLGQRSQMPPKRFQPSWPSIA